MEVARKKLIDEKGEIALHGAVILVVAVLLFLAVLEAIHVYTTIEDIKTKTNEAVLSTAALNVAGIYQGVREGDWNARQYTGSSWAGNVDDSQVVQQLAQSTGGQLTAADALLKENSYQISGLRTTYVNDAGDCLNFTTTLNLEVFLKIGGVINIPIPYTVEVKTSYATKF